MYLSFMINSYFWVLLPGDERGKYRVCAYTCIRYISLPLSDGEIHKSAWERGFVPCLS